MNSVLEIAVIASAVGIAALFVVLRVIKALRGGRPSCCSDAGETGQRAATDSCPDPDAPGPDGKPKPRPSYCAGCTGCGPRS